MIKGLQAGRSYWKVLIAVGLALALISLALLIFALTPVGEPLRLQATLAPTLFAPPPGGLP
jgi:hypothetical protein